MDDLRIIELYFDRNEAAIKETHLKYGNYIFTIAKDLLTLYEDAEECASDTYVKLWNTIPPERPVSFKAYLGRIVRNSALSRIRYNKAAKRDCGICVLLSELQECIPSDELTENAFDEKQLSLTISQWLKSLSEEKRAVFVKRYWYGKSVKELSEITSMSQSKISSMLFNLRKQLKNELIEKGAEI